MKRYSIERANAWIDNFKTRFNWFDKTVSSWKFLNYIVFIVILLKKFKKVFIPFFLLLISVAFSSCENEEDYQEIKDRTVIVYMLANNNLYSDALNNINEMESVWNNLSNGNLVVIIEHRSGGKKLELIEIKNDNNTKYISSPTVTIYEDKDAINPLDMNYIINDVIQKYPSRKYSLILWSHATGWLPPNTILRSFGESDNVEMDIHDLARSIPSNLFDVLIFDACNMGSIEILYELKEKANYIVASPTEILAKGFPYSLIIPSFFENDIDAVSIGKTFFDYYDQQMGEYRSATIGVVKTSELKFLAQKTKELICNAELSQSLYERLNYVQFYDRYQNKIFFDFKQVIECIDVSNNNLFPSFLTQLEKAVIYSAHTNIFLNQYEIKNCSGLSCFIPNKMHSSTIKNYYKTLSWYNDSGFDKLFGFNLD